MPRHLHVTELDQASCVALLTRNHLGRLAFTFRDRVDIEPISYVYADGWLYLRTSPGTKLTAVTHHPYVAFEVDEVRDTANWTSVVARGTIYFLDADRSPRDASDHERAVEILRSADSCILTADDPTPYRSNLFRIHVDELSGRAAVLD